MLMCFHSVIYSWCTQVNNTVKECGLLEFSGMFSWSWPQNTLSFSPSKMMNMLFYNAKSHMNYHMHLLFKLIWKEDLISPLILISAQLFHCLLRGCIFWYDFWTLKVKTTLVKRNTHHATVNNNKFSIYCKWRSSRVSPYYHVKICKELGTRMTENMHAEPLCILVSLSYWVYVCW